VGDCLFRAGIGELLVGGVQVGDAAREPLFTGISRHQESSANRRKFRRDVAPTENYVSEANFIPYGAASLL
jgi:hypothetical protein